MRIVTITAVLYDLASELAEAIAAMQVRLNLEQSWRLDALCHEPGYDLAAFYPERGQPTEPARAVCARCAVRDDCRDFALTEQIKHGIWGGTTERERRRLRREHALKRLERGAA